MTDILILAPKYPPYAGGAAQYFRNLVDSIQENYNICVATPYHKLEPIISKEENKKVYRIIPRSNRFPVPLRICLETITMFFISIYLILYNDVDVVHAHATSYSTVAFGMAAAITRTPIIYDCRDEDFPEWVLQIGDPQIVFSCAPNIDEILLDLGFSCDQIIRVPVVNADYVSEYELQEPGKTGNSEFMVTFVGYFNPIKNIQLLINGFSDFLDSYPGSHLTIVGDGPLRNDLKELISKHGISDSITFTGSVSHREALEQMRKSDALVLPSSTEGDPRVIHEAMQIGVPIITTPVGTVPEMLKDGKSGIIIEQSRESIFEALRDLYESPQLRRKLARNAKQISREHNWKTLSQKIEVGYSIAADVEKVESNEV